MIHIDRLRLHLPASYQGRAQEIARLVASELEGSLGNAAGTLPKVQIGPLHIAPGTSDRAIAQQVATSVAHRVTSTLRGQ